MQTLSVGKTHTVGLVIFSRPGKWTLTSAGNISCLSDSHNLHRIFALWGWDCEAANMGREQTLQGFGMRLSVD
jgi:hypothetical protein